MSATTFPSESRDVELGRGVTALERLAANGEWEDVWRRCAWATPFQHPSWLVPWTRAFTPRDTFVVMVREGGKLAAVAPFFVIERDDGLVALPLGAGISDYLDVVATNEPVLTRALAAALAHAHLLGCRALELPCVRESSPLEGVLRTRNETRWESEPSPVVALDAAASPEEVVPHGFRRKLDYARRRAQREGGLDVEHVGAESIGAALDVVFDLHARRWRARGESGVLEDPRVRRFHREAAPVLARSGVAHAVIVRRGERPVAALYGLRHGTRAYYYIGGFDPAEKEQSFGSIAIAAAMERAAREGARSYDMLRGREPYKYRFGARDEAALGRRFLLA